MHGFTRRATLLGIALLLASLLTACGTAPGITIVLDAASTSVLRGQSVDIDVALTRTGGATADVLLSAHIEPSTGVTAVFSPDALSASTLTSTLTIAVSPAAAAGPLLITVAANADGLAATRTLTLTLEDLTVQGTVFGLIDRPMEGVMATSQGVSGVTGIDGRFTLEGLSTPYDVTLSSAAGDGWVHAFEGLAEPNPEFLPYGILAAPDPPTPVVIDGSLNAGAGGTIPVPVDHVVRVCVEGVDLPMYGCSLVTAGATSYSLATFWSGAPTQPARLHALEYEIDGNGRPVAYIGYGTVDMTVTRPGPATQVITLGAAPASSTLSGTAVMPAAITEYHFRGGVRISDTLSMPIFNDGPSMPSTLSVSMPALAGMTYDLSVSGQAVSGVMSMAWLRGTAASAGTIVGPNLPVAIAPAAGATGVTTATEFQVVNSAGGVSTFLWLPAASGPVFAVTTMADSASIPTGSGVALPAAANYDWSVATTPGVADADLATKAWIEGYLATLLATDAGGPGPAKSGSLATGSTSAFVTAP